MKRLQNKVAIVTGAASGIGRASALLFAREGANVLAVDLAMDALREVIATAEREGVRVIAHEADAGDEEAVKGYVAKAVKHFGSLDVVYANAGISGGFTPLFEQTASSWAEILRVNLIGPFLAVKHAAPHLVARGGGSIILTASVGGLRANAGGNPYSASKAGVISLAQTAANSLQGTAVRVNAICPGLIRTGMTQSLFRKAGDRGTSHKIGQLNPLRRPGSPEEISAMALFLAGDEATYVNGQAIAVDGGLSSSHPFAPAQER